MTARPRVGPPTGPEEQPSGSASQARRFGVARRLCLKLVWASLLLGAMLPMGCQKTPTQLLVVVGTDLEVPVEVASLLVSARPVDMDPKDADPPVAISLSDEGMPLSFVVAPKTSVDARVAIRVRAFGPTAKVDKPGQMLHDVEVFTGFARGKTLRVPVFLAAACLGLAPCPDAEVCDARGECVSAIWPPEDLLEIDPGTELDDVDDDPRYRPDRDGAMDADVQPEVDAGPMDDGGSDLPVDAAAGEDASADGSEPPMCPCEDTACDDQCDGLMSCERTCESPEGCALCLPALQETRVRCERGPCAIDAPDSDRVLVDCASEQSCAVRARGAAVVELTCAAGAVCDLDCDGVRGMCALSCGHRADSSCRVSCGSADGDGQCELACAGGQTTRCADGTLVCRRDCPSETP